MMRDDQDDEMRAGVIDQMLGDTEKHTDADLFPPEKPADGTVTITISAPGAAIDTGAKPEEGDDDGGYAAMMDGLGK